MSMYIKQKEDRETPFLTRSVFVGNIPYEATEEKLKDIFSQAGSVGGFLHFKMLLELIYNNHSSSS